MTGRVLPLALLPVLVLLGCGDDAGSSAEAWVPATDRALAAVVLDGIDSDEEPTYLDGLADEDPSNIVAASAVVRFGVNPESADDGATVAVAVAVFETVPDVLLEEVPDGCAGTADRVDGCRTEDVEGGRLTISRVTEEPEEDPGSLDLLRMDEDGGATMVSWNNTPVLGDPAEVGLANDIIDWDELHTIALDPRLAATTTQEMVDAGEELPGWGEDTAP